MGGGSGAWQRGRRGVAITTLRNRRLRGPLPDPAVYRRNGDAPDLLQHVIARAVHGDQLFPDDEWRDDFAVMFAAEAHDRQWDVWSMVLMGTHYHVLLSTPDASLSAGLRAVHSNLAHLRNRAERARRGRLIGTRFKAIRIRDGDHLRACLRYIPMNPVKAQLCPDPSDWRWSTFNATIGRRSAPRWLRVDQAWRAVGASSPDDFARFVRTANSSPLPEPPRDNRDWTRFDVERLLHSGASPTTIATRLGITCRRVEQIARQMRSA
jgi:REP element-mobilizing transposase RayT